MYSAHVHVFFMQIVPLDLKSGEQELKVFNVHVDDFYTIDLTFLQGFDQSIYTGLLGRGKDLHIYIIHVHTCTCTCVYTVVSWVSTHGRFNITCDFGPHGCLPGI